MSHFAIDVPDSLVQRAARGDEAAFERLYRLFERPAYTLAWRMLGDREDAQEVLHDAMLALIQRLDQYRGDAPFWGWFRRIVVNAALMRLRQRHPASVAEPPEPDIDPAPAAPALEAADLERALAALPSLTRSVVWLYCVEGYTHEEIAADFGRSVSFSKSQLMRGARRLRALLEPAVEVRSHV